MTTAQRGRPASDEDPVVAETSLASRRLRRRLAVMVVVDSIGTGLFLTIAAVFFTRFVGVSSARVGLGLSIGGLVGLLATMRWGVLADRVGPHRVLGILSLWRACGFAAYTLVQGFGPFLAVVCFLGMADRAVYPVTQAVVGSIVEEHERVRTMAAMRALRNIGFTVGALLAGLVLTFDSRLPYNVLILANAASFLFVAVVVRSLPAPKRTVRVRKERDASVRLRRDRPYMVLVGLNSVLSLHMTLLSVGIPLWVIEHTSAPRYLVAVLLMVNTVLAVALQVHASRRAQDLHGSGDCLRLAGFALAVCCVLLAAAGDLPVLAAVVVLAASMLGHTAGELLQSVGEWGVSFELAPKEHQTAYLSAFSMGGTAQQIIGPAFLTGLVIATGTVGWIGLALLFGAAGLAAPRATRWAMANRPITGHHAGLGCATNDPPAVAATAEPMLSGAPTR